ncbi:hypothetical protein sos41_05710 [Alphaproteobacteria bacterium SO-S41]|nr:hypothetical protein sos41_05710 [Alphaproteobacteria bacterium SO-S41]
MSNYAERNLEGHHQVSQADPEPVAHLKREHHKFRTLVDRINAASEPHKKKAIAEDLHRLLKSHITLEEEIFYPAIKGKGLVDEINEGLVEHDIQRFLSAQIEAMDETDELYGARLGVLGELLVHHIDEEDDEMFLEARKAKVDFEAIAEAMERREDDLKAEYRKTGEMQTPELDAEVAERNAV